jgi:processive 1,2-diacylglycerol beta-glucosyltransferase
MEGDVITLFDNEDDSEIGRITESQLDQFQEELVEETIDATTYELSVASIDRLEMNGAEPEVIELLRKAMGSRTSMEVRFDLG